MPIAANKTDNTPAITDHAAHHNELATAVNNHVLGIFNVHAYGAIGDGTTDDYDAIQAAITAAEVAGGEVRGARGKTYYLNKASAGGLKLARNNDGSRPWVRINLNGATIKLSSNVPRFLDFNKVADHDTFQKIEVRDLTIDANNIGGKHHVIIGTYQAGVIQTRINVSDLKIRDVNTVNVLTTATSDPDHRLNIHIFTNQSTASEGTQNYLHRIYVDDVHMEGGNEGIGIGGGGILTTGLNVFIDEIHFRRCWFSTLVAPTGATVQVGYHICSRGFGGRGSIKDCYAFGSGDVGIETNSMDEMLIENCKVENCNRAYYRPNYNNAAHPAHERTTYRDCVAVVNDSAGDQSVGWTFPFALAAVGDIYIKDCSYLWERNVYPGVARAITSDTTAQFASIHVEGFEANIRGGWTYVGVGSATYTAIQIANGTNEVLIRMRDVTVNVTGTRDAGSGAFTVKGIYFQGLQELDLDGISESIDIANSTANALFGIDIGAGASTIRGRIKGHRIKSMTGDSGPRGLSIRGTGTLTIPTRILIEGCDYNAMSAASDLAIFGNADKLAVRDIAWRSGSAGLSFASAATLAVPDAPLVEVTGTTGITAITPWPAGGGPVTLKFTGILTVTDNNGTLNLAGNLTTAANTTLTVISDGTNVREVARSVN